MRRNEASSNLESRPSGESRLRLRRVAFAVCLGAAAFAVGAEMICRHVLGLGDPPLIVRDPEIEYLFAPSRAYHRFGNTISYNAFSMRADEVSPHKTDPNELRVLVIGDSVINGGALTDDSQLATRIVQERLAKDLKRPLWVGNVSAGSWGPGNQLAYLRRFGTFDADIAILVLSTHDIADVPDFVLGPAFPESPPVLAMEEAVYRYLPRYVPWHRTAAATPAQKVEQALVSSPKDAASMLAKGRAHLRALVDELRQGVGHVVVMHHEERGETLAAPSESARLLRQDVEAVGLPYVELEPYLARAPRNQSPYRDGIHIDALGQWLYADAMECVTLAALGRTGGSCV